MNSKQALKIVLELAEKQVKLLAPEANMFDAYGWGDEKAYEKRREYYNAVEILRKLTEERREG